MADERGIESSRCASSRRSSGSRRCRCTTMWPRRTTSWPASSTSPHGDRASLEGCRLESRDPPERDLGPRRLHAASLGVQSRARDEGCQSRAAALHGVAAGDATGGGLPARSHLSRVSRPGQPHHGLHALGGKLLVRLARRRRRTRARFLEELPADEYPYLAEHIEQHVSGPGHEGVSDFEFVLDLILDGLEGMREPG